MRKTAIWIVLAMIATLTFQSRGACQGPVNEASLDAHQVPLWYKNAKLGIMIHWGLYSVPGWAPLNGPKNGDFDNQDWMRLDPYAEWYCNTMRIDGSPTQAYHREHYGSKFNYYDFADAFNSESKHWNPAEWADIFKQSGARYVVLTSKHHDGFALWPTQVVNPHLTQGHRHSERDIVGDLTRAVRKDGMRMGVYYSGGFDWTFVPGPFHTQQEASAGTPESMEYAKYVDAQYRELIARYKPDILWNDIRYPERGKLPEIFAVGVFT